MFQGNELPKLLLMLAIAVGGWAVLWNYVHRVEPDPPEPEELVSGIPAPVEPDRSPEFETVTDKTPIAFRETAAYDTLLTRAREATPEALARDARRDIFYNHLWHDPGHYRGVPIHLRGIARRILRYESKLSESGWLYEAWVITPDQVGPLNPMICVFEDAPNGLRIGMDVSEKVTFDGYFFKLMPYNALDKPRAAPLLVGRLGWKPERRVAISPNRSYYWLAGGVALMFVVTLARWFLQLQKSLRPKPTLTLLADRPTETIAPEQLSSFLENLAAEDESSPEPTLDEPEPSP